MRVLWRGLWLLLPAAALSAQTVTLPAAASIVGGAPFFSDVRVFNRSYSQRLDATATYRCFLGACPPTTPVFPFSLSPRESMALDDICVTAFHAPNSAGGVEFVSSGAPGQLVVTSRLYSTSPTPTVGMFIPGLRDAEASPTTVLTSIRNGGEGLGFRANVGVFNNRGTAVSVTFTIFVDGSPVGVPVTIVGGVPSHSGRQVNGIFAMAGVPSLSTDNAAIVVSSSGPVFSYAAVIDNTTTDPILVVGAVDQPLQAVTSGPTRTRTTSRTATATPSPSPTPGPTTWTVFVGAGGEKVFLDEESGTSTTVARVGDTVHWVWVDTDDHDTVSGTNCSPDGRWQSPEQSSGTFDYTFTQVGNYPYYCTPHCDDGMTGLVIVNP